MIQTGLRSESQAIRRSQIVAECNGHLGLESRFSLSFIASNMTVRPLATIGSGESLEKILDAIARDGGVIVANFLEPALLEEIMTGIEPYFKGRKLYDSKSAAGELGNDFFPQGSQRIYALLGKIPDTLSKILRLSVWRGVMERYLV